MSANPPSILVIDDDAAIRTLLGAVLKRKKMQVDFAPNGEEGLARLETQPYSVIILDLMMPKFDGFEFIQRLSDTKPDLRKRVIVLTAVSHNTLTRLDVQQIWGVVRKPFDIDDLVRSVENCAAQPAVDV
jgi:CheY-like chemotaxis protein